MHLREINLFIIPKNILFVPTANSSSVNHSQCYHCTMVCCLFNFTLPLQKAYTWVCG